MPTRFDAYRMRDGVTPLSEDFFNGVFADIDTRIAELETKRADWNQVLAELTEFGLERIDVLVGPAMAEVNAMLAELRTKRDELLATIGNIGNLVTQTELGTALDNLADSIDKAAIGLGQVDNVSAASLRARATHTGEQPMASVTGLAEALGAKVAALLPLEAASNTNAIAGRVYLCNTSAGPFSLTLPATPENGDRVGVYDVARSFEINHLTVKRSGKKIEGAAEDFIADTLLRGEFVYHEGQADWLFE